MNKGALQTHVTFASIVSSLFAVFFGMNALKVALPTLLVEFDVSTSTLAWIVIGYSLTYSAVLPVTGRLGDSYGHARVILAGVAVFAGGTLLSAIAPNLPVMLVGRLIAGAGGGAIFPNVMVLTTRLYPPETRARTVGMVASVASISGVLGPGLGGLLLSAYGWRSIFYVTLLLVPVAMLGVVRAMRQVAGSSNAAADASGGDRSILVSSMMLLLFVTLLLLALEHFDQLSTWPYIVLLPGFFISAAALFAVERRQGWQLLDFRLLKGPAVIHGTWTGIIHRALIQVDSVVLPLFLALRLGLNEAALGAVLLVGAAIRTVMAPLGGAFSDRVGRGSALRIGFGAVAVAYFILAYANANESLGWTIVALAISAVGGSSLAPSAWSLVLNGTPPDRQGVVSGLYDTLRVVAAMAAVMVVSTSLQLEDGGAFSFSLVLYSIAALMTVAALICFCIPRDFSSAENEAASRTA